MTNQKDQSTSLNSKRSALSPKKYGVRAIAKSIIDEGDADGLMEAEFTTPMMDEARLHQSGGETDAQALARFYRSP